MEFDTPRDTAIPTITSAIDAYASRFRPFVAVPDKDMFLRHLNMFHGLIDRLLLGSIHLNAIAQIKKDPEFEHFLPECADVFAKMREDTFEKLTKDWTRQWGIFEKAIFIDATKRGIERKSFLEAPMSQENKPYRGARNCPPAEVTMWRMLNWNMEMAGAEPYLFLIRQLAMRIIFAAYAKNFLENSACLFLGLIRATKLPHEWHEALELRFAARLHSGTPTPQDDYFGFMILREMDLMGDLFELVLRQLQDPIPDRK